MIGSRVWDMTKSYPWPRIEWKPLPVVPPQQHEWWPITKLGVCRMILGSEQVPCYVVYGHVRDRKYPSGMRTEYVAIGWSSRGWHQIELDDHERNEAVCALAPGYAWAKMLGNARKERLAKMAEEQAQSRSFEGDSSGTNPSSSGED